MTAHALNERGDEGGHLEQRFSRVTMVAMTVSPPSKKNTSRTGTCAPVQTDHMVSFATVIADQFFPRFHRTWICNAGVIGIVMPSGGPIAFFYGFVICVACNLCISASLGELASVWPTAGGQYHWAYALASENWKALMSFLVGWMNIAGWLTLITTEAFFAAQFLSAGINIGSNGAYEITPWRTYLIFAGVSSFTILLNIYGYRILGKWNEGALFWSILGCVVIGIVIIATSDKNSASYVFTGFDNTTGWDDGVAWILGLLQTSLSLIGFDAVAHMTEEMPHPTRDAPVAMIAAVIIGGVTGTGFILIILFAMTDVPTILASPTKQPLTELVYQATGSRAAAVVLSVVPAICFINGTNGCVTSGSRLLWAMARDGGSPFSQYLSKVDPKLHVPVRAIMMAAIFNMLFGLLYLGPSVAFNAYIASCTIFLNASYAGPVMIVLIRGRQIVLNNRPDFSMGYLGGLAANWVSVLFVVFITIFFQLPNAIPVTAGTMNYVSAVVGIFIMFVAVLWCFKRKTYQGPHFDLILGELPAIKPSPEDPERLSESGDKEKKDDLATQHFEAVH